MEIPYSHFKHIISKHFHNKSQADWNEETSNKLHCIKPKLKTCTSLELNRQDNLKYTRL